MGAHPIDRTSYVGPSNSPYHVRTSTLVAIAEKRIVLGSLLHHARRAEPAEVLKHRELDHGKLLSTDFGPEFRRTVSDVGCKMDITLNLEYALF